MSYTMGFIVPPQPPHRGNKLGATIPPMPYNMKQSLFSKKKVTVLDYLNDLPDYLKVISLREAINPTNLEYKVDNLKEAIELAFWWDETVIGDAEFWEAVSLGEQPPIPLECVDGPCKGTKQLGNPTIKYIELYYREGNLIEKCIYERDYKGKYHFVQKVEKLELPKPIDTYDIIIEDNKIELTSINCKSISISGQNIYIETNKTNIELFKELQRSQMDQYSYNYKIDIKYKDYSYLGCLVESVGKNNVSFFCDTKKYDKHKSPYSLGQYGTLGQGALGQSLCQEQQDLVHTWGPMLQGLSSSTEVRKTAQRLEREDNYSKRTNSSGPR
jgi:hypothetical protein